VTEPSDRPAPDAATIEAAAAEDLEATVAADVPVAARAAPPREIRHRSEWEIRWRQARNAPPPVVRAVLANVAVAFVGGIVLLLTDWLAGGDVLPGYLLDLGPLIYVVVVIISGSLFTYLWVELPTGVPGEKRRSPWAGVLGFFASIPIVYLALVIIFEILRPLLP
jgi:hypothetical protein